MGGGDGTLTPNSPTKKDDIDKDYRAAARVGPPPSHSPTPSLLIKFDVQNITLNLHYFEHHPGERSKRSVVAAAAVSTATVAPIDAITIDNGSQQWQWLGQATAAETEAATGEHNNQPTDGRDNDRNGICGGGSGDSGSHGSG